LTGAFSEILQPFGWGRSEGGLLGFGFVSAQLQGSLEPAPSPKPRQNPKILAPNGYSISSNPLTTIFSCRASGKIIQSFPDD